VSKSGPTPEELDKLSNALLKPDATNPDGSRMSFTEYVEHLKETNPEGGSTNSG